MLNDDLAVILLAAGNSSRLGQTKQLVRYQGKPLLAHQIAKALTITKNVYCIIGAHASEINPIVSNCGVKSVFNSNWREGMSSSIACGANNLTKSYAGVMIFLVDQWQLSAQQLAKLVAAWRAQPDKIVVACSFMDNNSKQKYQGPPVIFPQQYVAELIKLTGDSGAKTVLQRHQNQLQFCQLINPEIDLDTPEDLARLKAHNP